MNESFMLLGSNSPLSTYFLNLRGSSRSHQSPNQQNPSVLHGERLLMHLNLSAGFKKKQKVHGNIDSKPVRLCMFFFSKYCTFTVKCI